MPQTHFHFVLGPPHFPTEFRLHQHFNPTLQFSQAYKSERHTISSSMFVAQIQGIQDCAGDGLTIWGVLLCLGRLLKVRLQLGWILSLENGWRIISSPNEALLVRLLRQLLFVLELLMSLTAAVCMLLKAYFMPLTSSHGLPARTIHQLTEG